MFEEKAACSSISQPLANLSEALDAYLQFEYSDALHNSKTGSPNNPDNWKDHLDIELPESGVGINKVINELKHYLLPNASAIPKPGFSSFITTGASTSAILANLSGSIASPQRYNLTAFNFVEELSLNWLRDLFDLPKEMKGVYSSGGSVANLIALGAARQKAFETIGVDPAKEGLRLPCRIYASEACHHTVHRAAAVLGMGRDAVVSIPVDAEGRMSIEALQKKLELDNRDKKSGSEFMQIAVVANAGSTDTGAIDPLEKIGQLTKHYGLWLHIDGAYGLPGLLDPQVAHLFKGLELADSIIVDPHKWLGAPVGIGATFVRDRSLLFRAFTQESTNYLEGSFSTEPAEHSLDSLGIPYADFGVELSAPSRGVVVWAIILEIGKSGLRDRVCRHNAMAQHIAKRVKAHPNLELALQPTLSICCFRYVSDAITDLDQFNRDLHRQLIHNGSNMPSTTYINNKLVIRPCFVGARAGWQQADALVDEVINIAENFINK